MNQSACFYSVASNDFLTIQKSQDKNLDLAPYIKASCILEGTFMGLEFTMVKGRNEETTSLIEEIFNPSESYGGADFSDIDIDKIDPEELEAMVMNDASIYFLAPGTISEISEALDSVTETEIAANYDAFELNENDVYPGVWQTEEANSLTFNRQHIVKDFCSLKDFLKKAKTERDFIITYMGD